MKTAITEDMNVHKKWYEEVKHMTVEKLPEFLRMLTEDYDHDYGTICHACAAAALAAAHAVNNSPTGGITGFQSGAIMWEFIRHWKSLEGPARLLEYNDLLYPQYKSRFRSISSDTWDYVQKKAQETLLKGELLHPEVHNHMTHIVGGVVPFGLTVEKKG